MAHAVKMVAFLPLPLRQGPHRNAITLKTCKRTGESIVHLFLFVKCRDRPPDLQMNLNHGGCGAPYLKMSQWCAPFKASPLVFVISGVRNLLSATMHR